MFDCKLPILKFTLLTLAAPTLLAQIRPTVQSLPNGDYATETQQESIDLFEKSNFVNEIDTLPAAISTNAREKVTASGESPSTTTLLTSR